MKITFLPIERRRLAMGLGLALIVPWFAPHDWDWVTRGLTGWNAGLWCYIALVWTMFIRSDAASIRSRARVDDDNAAIILACVCGAASASLLAIGFELASGSNAAARTTGAVSSELRYGLAVATVVGGWVLVPTVFAVHYAHAFYAQAPRLMSFPDRIEDPDYFDFLYFSFTISVASQTADVSITSRRGRRLVLAHSVLSYLFNACLVAMAVNIGASLVS